VHYSLFHLFFFVFDYSISAIVQKDGHFSGCLEAFSMNIWPLGATMSCTPPHLAEEYR
jgi:hypothetical protein